MNDWRAKVATELRTGIPSNFGLLAFPCRSATWASVDAYDLKGAGMGFRADSVQGVLFVPPTQLLPDAISLWSTMFLGESPDGFQKPAASPNLQSSANGERNKFQVQVSAQVGRIDVVLLSPGMGFMPSTEPPRIADVEGAVKFVRALLDRIVDVISVNRVAIVLDLAENVPAGEDAAVISHLPNFGFPKNSTDIILQFNAKKPSSRVPGSILNRLCTWRSGKMAFIQSNSLQTLVPFISCKYDVNSVPDIQLPEDSAKPIIQDIEDEILVLYREGVTRLMQ